jgi:hypothetical protein
LGSETAINCISLHCECVRELHETILDRNQVARKGVASVQLGWSLNGYQSYFYNHSLSCVCLDRNVYAKCSGLSRFGQAGSDLRMPNAVGDYNLQRTLLSSVGKGSKLQKGQGTFYGVDAVDGINSYILKASTGSGLDIRDPSLIKASEFSIILLFRPESVPPANDAVLIDLYDSRPNCRLRSVLYLGTDGKIHYTSSAGSWETNVTLPSDAYTEIIFSVNGRAVDVYVDEQKSFTATDPALSSAARANRVHLFYDNSCSNNGLFFIARVRYYLEAIKEAQLALINRLPDAPKADWHFSAGSLSSEVPGN